MKYLHKSISELHNLLLKGEVTPLQLVEEAIEKAIKDDNNAFEYISKEEAYQQVRELDENKKNNLLWGIPYVLKDNFSTKDIPTTGSSNLLNGYIPPFSSEVYLRLKEQGAILIGKTTLDELAMGGTGTTGHLGKTYNPWDKSHTHQIGGSSCGSASVTAASIVPFAIGSDTGDSVRKPASYSALVGFKPTWGRISRFGLFPFAPSLDHVAFFTRNVYDSAILLSCLAGKDEKDSTCSTRPVDDYLSYSSIDLKGKKVAVINEIFESVHDEEIRNAFLNSLKELENQGIQINYVHMDLELCKAIFPTYYIISCAEATSNLANLDGIKFGERKEGIDYESIILKTRSEGFSNRIKRRFVIGSYSLLKENQHEIYLRALKSRRLIVTTINEILENNDVIYLPASPDTAPLFEGRKMEKYSNEYNIADNYLAVANMGGQPSITIPLGFKNNLPFGGNVIGKIFDEKLVLAFADKISQITGLIDLVAPEK